MSVSVRNENPSTTVGPVQVPDVDASRTVVLIDTSVLLHDPASLLAYPDCDVVLPLTVIDELDRKKNLQTDVGANARETIRFLEELRAQVDHGLREPVELANGATLVVERNHRRTDLLVAEGLDPDDGDHRILAAALGQAVDGRTVRIVSLDAAFRIKAAQLVSRRTRTTRRCRSSTSGSSSAT